MPANARFSFRRKRAGTETAPSRLIPDIIFTEKLPLISQIAVESQRANQDHVLNTDPKLPAAGRQVARGARAVFTLLIAAFLLGTADPSAAQTVPVPKPAPKGRDGAQMNTSENQRGPTTTGATQAVPPNPVIPDPHRNVPANIFATFDASQKAQAARVSAYLSSLQTLVGQFVQVGPDGTKTKGDFYIQKPGKVRFEYDPPVPIDI